MSMKEPVLPANVNQQLSDQTKAKIQAEITNLQRQLELFSIESSSVDFSMLQTYKQMIHARQQALSTLPASF